MTGAIAGAVAGSVIGGITGKAIAERINPQHEDDYWRNEFPTRSYAAGSKYGWDDYEPAFRLGYKHYPDYHGRGFDEVEPEFAPPVERGPRRVAARVGRGASRDARCLRARAEAFEWATPGGTGGKGSRTALTRAIAPTLSTSRAAVK